jgi:hypothetical protein
VPCKFHFGWCFKRVEKKPQISPLRCAPVEMTILLEDETPRYQEESVEPQIPRLRSG